MTSLELKGGGGGWNLREKVELGVSDESDGEEVVDGRSFVEGKVSSLVQLVRTIEQSLATRLRRKHKHKHWNRI